MIAAAYPSDYYSFHLSANFAKYEKSFWGNRYYSKLRTALSEEIQSRAADLGKQRPNDLFVLDYGAGDGFRLKMLAEMGFNKEHLTAYEPSLPQGLSMSESFETLIGQDFLRQTDKQFDLIYASHVIEHLEDPSILLQDSLRVMKENSILVIDMPVPEGVHFNLTRHHHWGGYHAPRHLNILSVKGLESLAPRNNMTIVSVQYLDDSWIMAQTVNSMIEDQAIRILPKFFRNAFAVTTKEKPTLEREVLYGFLSFLSKLQRVFDHKSSVARITLQKR